MRSSNSNEDKNENIKEKRDISLYQKLIEHDKKQVYPMHMPGHKRNCNIMSMASPYSIDITEIDGFDNMHHPKGVIKTIEDEANRLYGAKRTWLSVNGTSIGLMAAICAATHKGDTILISRNCHKSVYNAIELNELVPEYIFPENIGYGICGKVFLTDIIQKVEENSKISVVVVTNPTYEGVISDIHGIAKFLHSKGIALIVDAAHGAHLGFNKGFPCGSIESGADIVVHSIHKTLPAFTQTSLLHLVRDELISEARLGKYISMFQSSSPSYILMAGIEKCVEVLRDRLELFDDLDKNLDDFYDKVSKLKYISILGYKDVTSEDSYIWRDKSKIVIILKNSVLESRGGSYIYHKLLDEYNIQLEMKSSEYALAMTSICDTKEGFDRLLVALVNIDKELDKKVCENDVFYGKNVGNLVDKVDNSNVEKSCIYTDWDYGPSEKNIYSHYPPSEIQKLLITRTKIQESVDKISAEYVYLYPPDIPLLVPGERITKAFIDTIMEYKERGLNIEGLEDGEKEYINVVSDEEK